ncbi:DUF4360 domain-containing protein [Endozoicomonas sp. SM1973]|uniref:DUF4360 domain-containing protein n=1 Tax=Spartinivicinus marinus TaxID=2994442 RepID=A0A853IAY9_9GAMM|nr:DUF4360 domain-containing protein [Spartinivicinus marinus]MCX4027423.1 DUF4360 domain-containing protein [Spartinivicinus marinus]NYZ66405.1 DUF4360 domain-containing protein [Spartinivicinus marinus]
MPFSKNILVYAISLYPVVGFAITPEFERIVIPSSTWCPETNPLCTCKGVAADANDDGTIDLIFNQFQAVSMNSNEVETSCSIQIPLIIPEGYQVSFSRLGIEGTVSLNEEGEAGVIIHQSMSDDGITSPYYAVRGRQNYYYDYGSLQDVVFDSWGEPIYTSCGNERVYLVAKINLIAKGLKTVLNIDEGAATVKFKIDYQRCHASRE